MRWSPILFATLVFTPVGCDKDDSKDGDETKVKKDGDDAKASADEGSDDGEPTGPTGEPHEVGETIELDNLELEVTEIRPCTYDKDRKNEHLAKKNQKLLGAHFSMKASGDERVRIRSAFKVHDADKVPYRKTSVSHTDCEPKIRSVKLQPGEAMKGWVGFAVPTSAKELTVTYTHKQHGKDDELATITVPD